MELLDKLAILADAAKYDAACTSRRRSPGLPAGHDRQHQLLPGRLLPQLLCRRALHHPAEGADDQSLCLRLQILRQPPVPRYPPGAFTPRELAELTIGFYRRNYIEGLFLSSGVLRSPDYTTEQMIECLRLLRQEYRFNGYIHAKAIPGTSPELVQQLGLLADRLSVNIELPSQEGLQTLAPDKNKQAILRPMASSGTGPPEQGGAGAV